jgi:hypothetical protein
MRIIGSPDNPASFTHSTDIGESCRDQSGTTIQFIWIAEDKPTLYSAAQISPIA